MLLQPSSVNYFLGNVKATRPLGRLIPMSSKAQPATNHQTRHLLTGEEHARRSGRIMTRHIAVCHGAHLGARNLGLEVDTHGIQNRRVGRRRRRWRGRPQLVGRVDRRRRRRLGRHGEGIDDRSERCAQAALSVTDKGPPVGVLLRNRSRKRAKAVCGGLRPDDGSRGCCGGGGSWRGGGRLIAVGVRT